VNKSKPNSIVSEGGESFGEGGKEMNCGGRKKTQDREGTPTWAKIKTREDTKGSQEKREVYQRKIHPPENELSANTLQGDWGRPNRRN